MPALYPYLQEQACRLEHRGVSGKYLEQSVSIGTKSMAQLVLERYIYA